MLWENYSDSKLNFFSDFPISHPFAFEKNGHIYLFGNYYRKKMSETGLFVYYFGISLLILAK